MKQKPLKDVPQERIDSIAGGMKDMRAMCGGEEYNVEPIEKFYSTLCQNIATEKRRIGGDWVIAHSITSKFFRDHMRKELGPELIFIILHLSREALEARMKVRHSEHKQVSDWLEKLYDLYEPIADNEPKTIQVNIEDGMSREEVAKTIIDMLDKMPLN